MRKKQVLKPLAAAMVLMKHSKLMPPSLSATLAAGLWLATGSAQAELASLGVLSTTYPISTARGISDNGQVVVGYSASKAFRWTDANGMTALSGLPAGNSAAFGVSADGSVIVGTQYGSSNQAFVWNNGSVTNISVSGSSVYGNDVSSDGNVVVGGVWNSSTYTGYAYRWTSAGGIENLGTLTGHTEATAAATNSNGSVVVGTSYGSSGSVAKAFRWTSNGMQDLGTLSSLSKSYATDVSADGSIVVGYSCSGCYTDVRAFKWTSSGMTDLGTLGGSQAAAYGISRDGNVIVGSSDLAGNTASRAFRWQGGAMQSVEDWLTANGVSVGTVATKVAYATNSDGSVVVGDLQDGTAFIARLTGGSGGGGSGGGGSGGGGSGGGGSGGYGSGLISVQQIIQTLTQAAAKAGIALMHAGVVFHGAHSRPLSRLVDAGRNAFWVAGDLGRDEHGERDGDLGLAEIGFGRNFGAFQLNGGLGYTWSTFRQPLDSHVKQDGAYLFAEGLIPLAARQDDGLWGALMGFYHDGETEIRRGYLNAGLPDASTGKPGSKTWGVTAGLEWRNLAQGAGFAMSPYASVSHTRTRMEAYTETGGGFPAAFSSLREETTDLRLGLNLERPLGSGKLFGTVEAVHRLDAAASNTTATILGPGGFTVTVPGQGYQRDWLRLGAGIEGKLGEGTGSVTLNATSQGEMPSYWLAASWRMAF